MRTHQEAFMSARTPRMLIALAAVAWIVVGGYGVWEIVADDLGEDWETPYAIFSIALLLGTLLTVASVWIASCHERRSPTQVVGLGFCAVAVLSTVAAWALPLWMTLSAVGYALVAAAGVPPWRRAVALLSAAQALGMAALVLGIAAEVGRQDEYGDHPVAFGIATLATAVATVCALVALDRSCDADAVVVRSQASEATP
jgi:hypothetical protein